MFQALFGRRNTDQEFGNSLENQRFRQIQSIRAVFSNITEVQRDQLYKIPFVAGGFQLFLEVELPSGFPHVAPQLKVTPPVEHPSVDEGGHVTGIPALTAFSIHSDLSRILREVISEFQTQPPKPKQRGMYSSMGGGVANGGIAGSFGSPVPTYTCTVFPKLNELTNSELKTWLAEPGEIENFVAALPQVAEVEKQREALIVANEAIAKANLSKKELVETKKRELLEKVDTYHSLRRSFDEQAETFDLLVSQFKPDILRHNVRVHALKAEEESDSTAESFLAGKLSPEQFLKEFMPTRTLSHTRHIKEEKLGSQLVEAYRM